MIAILVDIFDQFKDALIWIIGGNEDYSKISYLQMVLRTIIVYGVALGLIRLGKRRFLGGYTAFDILMGFVVGSIMSRAITGGESFFGAILVISTLMAIHYFISYVGYYYSDASKLVKNQERQLIKDGVVDDEAMLNSKLGDNDLLQALRQKGSVESASDVKSAYLERDGSITVIPKEAEPRILTLQIEKGVQTVKIVLDSSNPD